MAHENQAFARRAVKGPAALLLAQTVEMIQIEGHFDESSQTWSNRDFACASAKKHNEAM